MIQAEFFHKIIESSYEKCGVQIDSLRAVSKPDFSADTIMTLKRNKRITINTLERLCKVLDCTPNDVVTFVEK